MTNREIALQHNQPLRIEGGMGAFSVECIGGPIWLTCPGRAGDIFLQAGECLEIRTRGVVLIEALGSGSIVLRRVPTWWRRRLAALRVVLSSSHEYLRNLCIVRWTRWRNPLAG